MPTLQIDADRARFLSMSKFLFALAVLAASPLAASKAPGTVKSPASKPSSTLAACESLKRQSDRNVCIAEVVRSQASPTAAPTQAQTPPPPSEKELALSRAEAVLTAADTLRSVTNSGVSYEQYGPYVQALAIALDRYRANKLSPTEQEAASALADALSAFQDASTYWWKDIEFFSRSRNRQSYPFALPAGLANTDDLVQRYQMPVRNADLFGFHSGVPRGDALRTIWQFAKTKSESARSILSTAGVPPATAISQRQAPAARIGNPTPELAQAIEEALLKAGCFKAGGLKEEDPINGQSHFWAECTHGQKQHLACTSTACILFDESEIEEQWIQASGAATSLHPQPPGASSNNW